MAEEKTEQKKEAAKEKPETRSNSMKSIGEGPKDGENRRFSAPAEPAKAAQAVKETEKQPKPPGGKVFTIPLRKAFRKSHLKRTNYAVSLVKDFVKRHLKATEVKMGEKLNQAIWGRLPRNVRIQAVKEGDVAKAELFGYEYKEFKAKPKEEKKGLTEKLAERLGPKAVKKQEEENMVEGEKMQKPEAPQKVIIPKEEKG